MLGPARTTRVYRYVRLGAGVFLMLVMLGTGLVEYWLGGMFLDGLPHRRIVAVTGACAVVLCGWLYVLPFLGPFGSYRWVGWATRVVVAVGLAGPTFGIFYRGYHQVIVAACLAVVLPTVAAWYFDRKMRQTVRSMLTNAVRDLPDRADATRMVEDVASVPTRKLKPDDRRRLAVNRARARIAQSVANDSPDGLVAAVDDLRAVLDDPPSDWQLLFQATEDLVAAMAVKATKHGDLDGYSEALDLLYEVADRPNADVIWLPVWNYRQAEGLMILAKRAVSAEQFEENVKDAVESLDEAISQAAEHRRDMLPHLHAMRAECLAMRAQDADGLEPAIAEARLGQRAGRWHPRRRAPADLALAELLTQRAHANLDLDEVRGSGVDPAAARIREDVTQASKLVRTLHRRADLDQRLALLELRAELASLSALLAGQVTDAQAAQQWRAASREARTMTFDRAIRVAGSWVGWSELVGDPALCAEAYQHLMSYIPHAVASRYLPMERYSLLFDVQEHAEEAGYWLARAGRYEDAAVALDVGRAVSISEVVSRDRPTLAAELAAAGRSELLAPYLAAVQELAVAERDTSRPGTEFSSRLQRAWANYDAVARQVSLVDEGNRSGTLISFEDLVDAARSGPMVYLAAANRTGYAIVVTADGRASWLPLPMLTRSNATDQAIELLIEQKHSFLAVSAALRWLWDNGIGDLMSGLPTGLPVTLIPIGVLSMLPVHAAGGPRYDDGPPPTWQYALDTMVVRYAPNARMLLRARDRARSMRDVPLALLAVDAPNGGQHDPIPHTRREVDELSRRWVAAGGVVSGLHNATLGQVRPELPHHAVWHFACHCVVELDDVLDSALIVEDGRVSLAELMAVPPAARRLAVLSACSTHQSNVQLPNEALGLPGGLMQIGFAAVVASHWLVPDVSAVFLMTRFYEFWQRDRLEPCAALTAAQRWLRRATRAELESYLPGVLTPPLPGSVVAPQARPDSRPFSHPYHWAAFAVSGV